MDKFEYLKSIHVQCPDVSDTLSLLLSRNHVKVLRPNLSLSNYLSKAKFPKNIQEHQF